MARHQAAILEFYGFRTFKPHGRALLAAEIARLVQSHLKPKLIFSRAVEVLVRDKVEVPGYFPLAALILSAINQHNRRLTATIEALLTPETRPQPTFYQMAHRRVVRSGVEDLHPAAS